MKDALLYGRSEAEQNTMRREAALAKRRVEIGEVETSFGRVLVAHDRDSNMIVIHGVSVPLSDIETSLRSAFIASVSAFAEAAQVPEEQVTARTLIGLVTDAILQRHKFLGAKVRERLFNLRHDV
jgi:hypothetical protein